MNVLEFEEDFLDNRWVAYVVDVGLLLFELSLAGLLYWADKPWYFWVFPLAVFVLFTVDTLAEWVMLWLKASCVVHGEWLGVVFLFIFRVGIGVDVLIKFQILSE